MRSKVSPTLDVDTCSDMLNKLERERARIDEAGGDRQKLSDHGINFAVTAWHLTDWVWRDMKSMYSLKAKIAKAVGLSPQNLGLGEFQQYVCAECADMVYCQAIGTASKHVGADPKLLGQGNYQKNIASDFSLTATTSVSFGSFWVLKIIDGGDRLQALPIFDNVLTFWTKFIYSNKIN
jgi:hypothetical protein